MRGVGSKEISTACAMMNNLQNIMLNIYLNSFSKMLEKQLEDPEKAVSLAQMFGAGESLRLSPTPTVSNTGIA